MKTLQRWRRIAVWTFVCAFLLGSLAFGQQADTSPPSSETASPATSSAVAPSPSPQTPEEIFARARKLSDLEAAGVPFHLKATFVASGDTEFTGDGTYEIWWRSKDQWQANATLKDFRLVEIKQDGKLEVWSSSSYVPLRLRQVLDAALLRPTAHVAGSDCPRECGAEWKESHPQINGSDTVTLTSQYYCLVAQSKSVPCKLQYSFTPDDIPQKFSSGAIHTVYKDFRPFQKVQVPRSITVASGGKTWLEISIGSVEALPPNQKLPLDDAALKELQQHRTLGSLDAVPVGARQLIGSRIQYPSAANGKPVQGNVVIEFAIDEQGRVREPYVVLSAGPLLDQAVLDAAQRWKYMPVRVNGHPVQVDTTMFFDLDLTAPASTTPQSTPAQPSSAHVVAHIPHTPTEFFARARQLTDLKASGIPFHLKATFVASGHTEFTGNGTYEIWWRSKDRWRVNATLKDYRLVKIEQDGKLKVWSSSSYIPLRLRQVLDAALIRPTAHNAGSTCSRKCGADWKQGQQQINGMPFTRLTSQYQCAVWNSKPVLCMLQYYFTADGVPRIFADEAVDTLYNDFEPFQKMEVPRSVTVALDGKTLLDISVRSVEFLPTGEKIPPEDTSVQDLQTQCVRCWNEKLATIVAPKLLKRPAVHYPVAANVNRRQGTVAIDASIDDNGKVREPYVFLSAGSLLDEAALDSVRRWEFRPFQVNGKPVPFNTTLYINFSIRQSPTSGALGENLGFY